MSNGAPRYIRVRSGRASGSAIATVRIGSSRVGLLTAAALLLMQAFSPLSERYVIGPGATYDLVVDARFIDGTYEFISDPHESVGMQGTMTVGTSAK